MQRLKRASTAYKYHLVERLMEKGNRAKEISMRKYKNEQQAQQSQIQLRQIVDQGKTSISHLEGQI